MAGAESDEPFRILVESIDGYAVLLLDPAGHVRSWNAGAKRIKGYEAAEVIGKHFSIFYPPEIAKESIMRQLELAERDGRYEGSGWRVRKDGSRFWSSVEITPLKREGKTFAFAKVTRDLTDRAFRTFVEATHAIMWTTAANGHPNADSPTWRAFTGQTEEEWRGLQAWDAVHPDDRPRLAITWGKAKETKELFEEEFRLRRHDGTWLWMACRAIPLLDAQGAVREWFGVTFDVHARKRAEIERSEGLEREHEARIAAERSQAQWTTTLASIGDAVIATDADGRVTFMNPIAEKLTGWPSADGLGRPLREVFTIVNQDTRRVVEDPVAKVLREGSIVGLANHTVLVRRDGTDVPIDDSAAPIRDGSGLFGVVMVFRDVSLEKREATRRAFLLRAGEELMAASDYRAALRTVVHLAVPRLADWCAVDIVQPGTTSLERLAVAHVDPAKVKMALDIERRYPSDPNAATGVPNVVRTGRSELYRVVPQELLEKAAVDEEHRRLIMQLRLHSGMIVPLRGRDQVFGALTFVYAESEREYTDDDLLVAEELARRAAIVIERRKLEDERAEVLEAERKARTQAEVANRAKDEFLATVSHELRNPLSAIVGWSKLLLQRDLPPDLRAPIATIERNAMAQTRLIEDMLDVSRIISGKLQLDIGSASVEQAIADALESARRAAEVKGVALQEKIEPGLEVFADRVRLQQVVANLVTNAVKFTPRGGRVSITAERAWNAARIVVSDTGEGIEPAMLERIFEPFHQADATTTRRHGGLGLGLAIVRELVVAHRGTVRATSDGPGKGASFTVEIPLAARGPETPRRDAAAAQPMPRLDGTRVLVIDDDADLIQLMCAILVGAGATVDAAASAEIGLERMRETRPDVVVSDVAMPQVDGYELIRRVRALPVAEGGRTPAIALTAYTTGRRRKGFRVRLPAPHHEAARPARSGGRHREPRGSPARAMTSTDVPRS